MMSQLYPFRLPLSSRLFFPSPSSSLPRLQQPISCGGGGKNINRNRKKKDRIKNIDADLSSALSIQAKKFKALAIEKEDAMNKSRQILFSELCEFAGISLLDMKIRWTKKMHADDKLVLVREFVSEWGTDFHPLSARSVEEMIEQHLLADEDDQELSSSVAHDHPPSSSHFSLFSGWMNLLKEWNK
ncbi:uncharacterized protein LOC124919071 [Impatiens glandulifera]|uniref:uncharacterized protein LOC124919071 n=1 Tax=Impatiens glandulifera TaxID=253017 RepID=UPI001FB085E0|nr:uncharacterized protein LOC124919071 [Impatiens glandulifera]